MIKYLLPNWFPISYNGVKANLFRKHIGQTIINARAKGQSRRTIPQWPSFFIANKRSGSMCSIWKSGIFCRRIYPTESSGLYHRSSHSFQKRSDERRNMTQHLSSALTVIWATPFSGECELRNNWRRHRWARFFWAIQKEKQESKERRQDWT